MNLYITRPGKLNRKDNTLQFVAFEGNSFGNDPGEATILPEERIVKSRVNVPIETIKSISLFSEVRLNSKLLVFLGQKKIPLHIFDYFGNHKGTYLPHKEQLSGNLIIKQAKAFEVHETRMEICKKIAEAKMHNALSIISYYKRRVSELEDVERSLREIKLKLDVQDSVASIMGLEGVFSRIYYQSWRRWFSEVSNGFNRVYHPPDNSVNSLLSFINSLLYTVCVNELYRTALYPGLSYLHSPQERRFSLALDISEPFKPLMVDRLLFRLFNQNRIKRGDFISHSNGVLISDDGRRKVLKEWDNGLKTTVNYPSMKRSVSYRQLIRLTCYSLMKHLLEKKPFKPYKIEYYCM